MSDKIRETLADAFAAYPGAGCDWDSFWNGWQAALSQQPAPAAQEPAAWRVSDPDEPDIGHWLSEEPGTSWQKSEPLYTSPPAAAQPGTMPMPHELLERVCNGGYFKMDELRALLSKEGEA